MNADRDPTRASTLCHHLHAPSPRPTTALRRVATAARWRTIVRLGFALALALATGCESASREDAREAASAGASPAAGDPQTEAAAAAEPAPSPAAAAPETPPDAAPQADAAATVAAVPSCHAGTSAASALLAAAPKATPEQAAPALREPPAVEAVLGDGVTSPAGMAWVPGGEFTMGSDHELAYPNERPARRVSVDGFWIDVTHVTNDEFAAFVEATGYVTTAERVPDWESIRVQLPPGTPRPPDEVFVPGAMVFVGTDAPVPLHDASQWWRYVPGADWRHPQGPDSSIEGKGDHPVVQVSYEDALAYAAWAGKRLPTEAEWERAARGGLERAVYPWGDEMEPEGERRANTWDASHGPFPVVHKAQGVNGTRPVASYPANGYGLHDMAGNAWQWVADWYRFDAYAHSDGQVVDNPKGPDTPYDPAQVHAPNAPQRVIRGGSYLCSPEYCLSFRTSARRGSDPASPMSHIGFRLVKDAPPPPGH